MKVESPIEVLTRRIPEITTELTVEAERYRSHSKDCNLPWTLLWMSSAHLSRGMYAFYANHDLAQFKQEFYVASRLNLCRYERHGAEDMGTGVLLSTALLSDCPQLIAAVAALEPKELKDHRDEPRSVNFLIHMRQLAIRGDENTLRQKIAIGSARSGKSYRDEYANGTDLFSLLLAYDKNALEARIAKRAKIRTEIPEFEGLMSLTAAEEAKICWRRGIEVQIDSPMLPMELMPIKPLEHYDDVYDFLKPCWEPPRQGLLGKIERFFKK